MGSRLPLCNHLPIRSFNLPIGLARRFVSSWSNFRDVLVRNGSVHRRIEPDRSVSYRLRYREYGPERMQRSIPLGNDFILADSLAGMLAYWRQPRLIAQAKHRAQEVYDRQFAREIREARKSTLDLRGGGRRLRRREGREFNAAIGKNLMNLVVCLMDKSRARRRPAGRPRKYGLAMPIRSAPNLH